MKDFRVNNWVAKLLAVLLAVGLWLYVMNEQNPQTEQLITVPLETVNIEEGLQAVDIPETVRVKIRGPRALAAAVQAKDVHAYVDFNGLTAGKQIVPVKVKAPPGVEVAEVNPERLTLLLDAYASKQVAVQVKVIGKPAEGLVMGQTQVAPLTVQVSGPRSRVQNVVVALVTIDVSGKDSDQQQNLTVQLLTTDGHVINDVNVTPPKVQVTIPISRATATKTVPVKLLTTGQPAAGFSVQKFEWSPNHADLRGTAESLKNIETVYTIPVSLNGLDKDVTLTSKLQLPEGITSDEDVAVQVKITLTKEPMKAGR